MAFAAVGDGTPVVRPQAQWPHTIERLIHRCSIAPALRAGFESMRQQ
jgi:hypothetical protein